MKQQARDRVKVDTSIDVDVKLVIIQPEDLCLKTMRQKISGFLPLRSLHGCRELINYLESKAREYRRKVREGWASTTTTAGAEATT